MTNIVTENLKLWYNGINNAGIDSHDNTTSSWYDLSGNENHGIITNPSWLDDKLNFDGSTWVNCGQHNYSNITLEVLVDYKNSGTTDAETNSTIGNWQSGGYGIQQKNKQYITQFRIGETWYQCPGSNCQTGTPVHLTATYDGTSIQLYENGVLVNEVIPEGITEITPPTEDTVLSIGSNPQGSTIGINPLKGYVYSVRVYDRALTASEIYTNYEVDNTYFKNNGLYVYTIDFSKSDWETAKPDVFTVTKGATPFYVANTFLHDGKNTLRSGAIGHGGNSNSTFNFTLVKDGYIELLCRVSSEGGWDKLRGYLDGVEKFVISGAYDWTTYLYPVTAGTHTFKVEYTKDGSGSSGSDAGAFGYIKLIGAARPYDKKYLLSSSDIFYSYKTGELVELNIEELSKDVFLEYGSSNKPSNEMLMSLINPGIIYWHDSIDPLPELKIAVTGIPPVPQTIITNTQDMSDSTILGIEGIQAVCSDDILFALSFDDETTWKAYDGTTWITLDLPNTGMTKTTMESIGLEAWAEVVTSNHYKVRFILPATTSYMTSMVVNYIN